VRFSGVSPATGEEFIHRELLLDAVGWVMAMTAKNHRVQGSTQKRQVSRHNGRKLQSSVRAVHARLPTIVYVGEVRSGPPR